MAGGRWQDETHVGARALRIGSPRRGWRRARRATGAHLLVQIDDRALRAVQRLANRQQRELQAERQQENPSDRHDRHDVAAF
jgi:hypothetical protein